MLGRIEIRTRDRIYCQTIRTVRYISRDDRAIIATCSLRTPKESIDGNLAGQTFCSSDDIQLSAARASSTAGIVNP